MKTYNVTVIGAGMTGKNHAKSWKQLGHHISSIVDQRRSVAEEIAAINDIPVIYEDYKEAICDPNVDIVSICLPANLHAPVAIFAAKQGKHILCEKPISLSIEEAIDIEKAVKEANVHFGLCYQRNVTEDLKLFKQKVQGGQFGKPLVYQQEYTLEVRPKLAMHDRYINNGPIVDNAGHFWLFWGEVLGSKVKSIYARGGTLAKDRPELQSIDHLALDTAVITMEYESGDIGMIHISWGLAKGTQMKKILGRIYGPKGGAEVDRIGHITFYEGDEKNELDIKQQPMEELISKYIESLESGTPAPIGIKEGKEMLSLSLATLESIKTGSPVYL